MCNDEVVRFLAANAVPVALNLFVIREQKDGAGDFFRTVQKQRPAQYQGLYLVDSDGKVLASHQSFKNEKTWPQELLADLRPGMAAFGAVTPRQVRRGDPSPQRGRGAAADGGATMAIYLRHSIKGIPIRELPNPTIDSLRLSAKELTQLAPPMLAAGAVWEIPNDLVRQFCRLLGPGDEDSMPRAHEVTFGKMLARVSTVDEKEALLVFEGALAGSHLTHAKKRTFGDVKVVGAGRVDTKSGRLESLIWVCDGVFKGAPPYNQPRSYSAVVEWIRQQQP